MSRLSPPGFFFHDSRFEIPSQFQRSTVVRPTGDTPVITCVYVAPLPAFLPANPLSSEEGLFVVLQLLLRVGMVSRLLQKGHTLRNVLRAAQATGVEIPQKVERIFAVPVYHL